MTTMTANSAEIRRKNLRTGVVLASVALTFFVGYLLRNWMFGA